MPASLLTAPAPVMTTPVMASDVMPIAPMAFYVMPFDSRHI
jgi:hypothetical protein